MGYTVKVDHPHFPEGTVFNVGGLDRVPNGSSIQVDEEMERLFIMNQGQALEDAFANDHAVTVEGTSSLDDDERNTLVEAYGPTVNQLLDESEPLFDDNDTKNQEQPSWLVVREGGEE